LLSILIGGGAAAAPSVPESGGDLPEYRVEDAGAAVVTEANLLASERFWPYHVGLTAPWKPADRDSAPPVGVNGVLLRVEEGGIAHIDFGRDGRFEVPVGVTDLVERANRIRRGELEKSAPNYVLAVGPRLLDPSHPMIPTYPFPRVLDHRYFLAVFADPMSSDFPGLAAALAPLRERGDLLTILFPQGGHPVPEVRDRLVALQWEVPFVRDYLVGPYTRSQLGGDPLALPCTMLHTAEGRVLHRTLGAVPSVQDVTAALDRLASSSSDPSATTAR
jgi:hypothetical protein